MNKLSVLVIVVGSFACTKAEDAREHRGHREMRVAAFSNVGPLAAPVAPSPGTLERQLLDLATCGLEGHQITATCPAMGSLAVALATPGGSKELSLALGKRLLAHTSPAVRLATAKLMGTDRASRAAIVEIANTEAHAGVRQALVRAVADEGATNPQVASLLFASASHPDASVRREALAAMVAPANRAMPGAAERLVAMVEGDLDPTLRREACAQAGKLGSATLLPMYERATTSTQDSAMYAACMEGLVAMFHNPPAFDTSSEGAYRMFLRELAETPRSESSPPWSVTSAFCYYSHDADLTKLAAWKRTATWFDPIEVKRVMTSVISDKAASWQARAAAVESMVGLGATSSELHALTASAAGKDESDRRVLAKISSALAE